MSTIYQTWSNCTSNHYKTNHSCQKRKSCHCLVTFKTYTAFNKNFCNHWKRQSKENWIHWIHQVNWRYVICFQFRFLYLEHFLLKVSMPNILSISFFLNFRTCYCQLPAPLSITQTILSCIACFVLAIPRLKKLCIQVSLKYKICVLNREIKYSHKDGWRSKRDNPMKAFLFRIKIKIIFIEELATFV